MDTINKSETPTLPITTTEVNEDGHNVFEIWKKYEDIAIHFNDLILKIRIQALGGIAALAALAGVVLKESLTGRIQWFLLGFSLLALVPIWVAVWVLDFLYYTPLLYGAVDAIRNIEAISTDRTKWNTIDCSTRIDKVLRDEKNSLFTRRGLRGPRWFYIIVLSTLLSMSILSLVAGILDSRSHSTEIVEKNVKPGF